MGDAAYWWKIKDGLFIGNKFAAQDYQLFEDIKATRVINCAGFSVNNFFEYSDDFQVEYRTYQWVDTDREVILDEEDKVADDVFEFIEGASDLAETVIVLSVNGQSRSFCLVVAYMMRKFYWSLGKAYEFVDKRRPENRMQEAFWQQLEEYEKRLAAQSRIPLSDTWDEAGCCSGEGEEVLLMNTFHNQKEGPPDPDLVAAVVRNGQPQQRLMWSDKMSDDVFFDRAQLEISDGDAKHNYDKNGQLVLRSMLKGRRSNGLACSFASTTAEGSAALGFSSTATPSSSSTWSKGTLRATATSAQPSPVQPPSEAHVPLRMFPPQGEHEKGAKVFRFLLGFDPPVLAIEWGNPRVGERRCTRIEFTPEDFVRSNARLLADRVVAASPLLTIWHKRTVESLLRKLAARSLPLYRISASSGGKLLRQPNMDAEIVSPVPFGALVLSCERVRRPDGWWLRIWSGHWVQELDAELCSADVGDAARWLRDATRSQKDVLLENARAVVAQATNNSYGDAVDLS